MLDVKRVRDKERECLVRWMEGSTGDTIPLLLRTTAVAVFIVKLRQQHHAKHLKCASKIKIKKQAPNSRVDCELSGQWAAKDWKRAP